MTSEQGSEDRPRTIGQRVGAFAKEFLLVVVGALVIAALIRAFLGQMFVIPSGSMENTLKVSDRIVVQKVTDFERGDVVVFADPGDWHADPGRSKRGTIGQALEFIGVLPDTSTDHLVKRAIGMPGDRVACCDDQGRVTVNGQPLNEGSYLYSDAHGTDAPSDTPFDVVVPADRIWVMGDHRSDSGDSRTQLAMGPGDTAFVPVEKVVGSARAIAAPMRDARILRVPRTFESVPEPRGSPPADPVIRRPHEG